MRAILLSLLLLSHAAYGAGREAAACARPVLSSYVELMAQWHGELAEIVAEQQPRLREAMELRTALHALQLRQQGWRFAWLSRQLPGRLELGQGSSGALRFAWDTADEQRLRSGEPEYRDLLQQLERVDRQERRHPRRDALEQHLQAGFFTQAAIQAPAQALQQQLSKLDQELSRCADMAERAPRSLTE